MTTTHSGLAPVHVSDQLRRLGSLPPSFYDRFSWLYDWIVGSEIYHRCVWGSPVGVHDAFAREVLEPARRHRVLDAGCGSLLFTAGAYRDLRAGLDAMTLFDLSTAMLDRAQKRVASAEHQFRFVQGDLLALPFQDGVFDTVLHFGVLHCMEDAHLVLRELSRVTVPGGSFSLSCLALGRPRGDRFLARLHRAGHVAVPRSEETILDLVAEAGFDIVSSRRVGSFLLVRAERKSD